jgi:hypothetical protein
METLSNAADAVSACLQAYLHLISLADLEALPWGEISAVGGSTGFCHPLFSTRSEMVQRTSFELSDRRLCGEHTSGG